MTKLEDIINEIQINQKSILGDGEESAVYSSVLKKDII